MNIFVLDLDPKLAAQMHTNRHVVKMITETAQILSAVLLLNGQNATYKLTHKNHPCTIWARESLSNWMWLRELGLALHDEYKFRYGDFKEHKAALEIEKLEIPTIFDKGLTPFALAMPDEYKTDDPVESYRNYYLGAKTHLFEFGNRGAPIWIEGI
jgi:hypothetical protein